MTLKFLKAILKALLDSKQKGYGTGLDVGYWIKPDGEVKLLDVEDTHGYSQAIDKAIKEGWIRARVFIPEVGFSVRDFSEDTLNKMNNLLVDYIVSDSNITNIFIADLGSKNFHIPMQSFKENDFKLQGLLRR